MDGLATFIDRAGGLVTILSVCFANPAAHDNYGCKPLWQQAGSHRLECEVRRSDTAAYPIGNGDRLRCDVTPMETSLAAILLKREASR
jgi:hypothetical protein